MSSIHAASYSTQIITPNAPPTGQPKQPASQIDSQPLQNSRDASHASSSADVIGRVNSPGEAVDAGTVEVETESSGAAAGDLGVVEQMQGTEADQGVSNTSDDSQHWSEEDIQELRESRRVKVYELIGSRWEDQGTAFCYPVVHMPGDPEATVPIPMLIARAELDENQVILSTTIRSNDVYQRQQVSSAEMLKTALFLPTETLIVWTEPDGVDYALSFQDADGCGEVWSFIEKAQRMHAGEDSGMTSSPLIGPEPSISAAHVMREGKLPTPQLGIMLDIEGVIKHLARTANVKERICEYIQSSGYIKDMIEVMHQAEDLESLENLHALCSCMQTILMLNDHSLYEHILDDELFFGVVGMLEYDPEFPTYKANYRDFLRQTSQFHQPIPIRDETIQRKVHHTYRLQFLKDVVLARAIDDSTFNVLNSCIIFNQIDIINHVQNDQAFLRELVGMFMDEDLLAALGVSVKGKEPDKMDVDTAEGKQNGVSHPNGHSEGPSSCKPLSPEDMSRRREVVFLIQQLCAMGKNIQLPARLALFRTLVDRGILFAVQWALSQPETDEDGRQMIASSGEILTTLLDHDLNGVRGHVLKQLGAMEREKANGKIIVEKETVLVLMCRVLVTSRDLAVQCQVGEALKALLEISMMDPADPHNVAAGIKLMQQRAKDDPGVEKFLDYFYKSSMDKLYRPILKDLPEFRSVTEPTLSMSREKTNLYLYLCDLLSSFALQHSFRSHFFILATGISSRVAVLLRAKDKHLRLAAFRYFRTCLRLKNGNIFKHFIKLDVLKPILELTIQESRRDNLLSSSCQEFFEFMRRENLKELIHHCMTQHEALIRTLADSPLGGPRFKAFIRRWEMNVEPPPLEEKIEKVIPNVPRRWGQGRLLEVEEEDYFNTDDDEEDVLPIISTPPKGHTLKRKRRSIPGIPIRPPLRPPYGNFPRTPPLGSLVDYDEGDDIGGAGSPDQNSAPSSPGIPNRSTLLSGGYFPIALSDSDAPPSSPRLPHRHVPSPKPTSPPHDEEDLLESLYKAGTSSPKLTTMPPDFGMGMKRRRDDDDDELLERLANKSKRPSVGPPEKENADTVMGKVGLPKSSEEGPKKIKLKFGAVGAAVASSSPLPTAPSSPGTKDGDNG
ncbi:hypothetical protein A0H81_09778 [Grifola frondosa]|uniref:Uncharacterized protein n=1 Tax=Grifola frondosa TaxID=5627 RepID=A0A1C7LZZ7_GRIFR|nr:hypothetical protein A0H81_09778 [Grifola frondosa]